MPDASPVQQQKYARFSVGRFVDGRKDNLWLYVKYVQARLHPDSPIQTLPSPDSTILEEYDRGKLLSRKPGPPYRGAP